MRDTKGIRVPRRSGGVGLVAVPMLVELAADPRRAGIPDERRAQERASGSTNGPSAPIYRLVVYDDSEEAVNGVLGCSGIRAREEQIPFDLDDLITVEDVAAVLHVRRQWLIRKARKYPFVKRLSRKKYVCSRLRLIRWLASGSNSHGAV